MASLTIVGLSLLVLLLIYRYILYPAFFSPLSKIPTAHFSAPILPLWIRSKRQTGTAVRDLLALHERHGPVVRLAPNEISVNSADAIRTVYVGGFEKHTWYLDAFVNYGVPNMVTMLAHKPHSVQKRMVSNVYSKSYLQNSGDLKAIAERLICDRFLPIMQQVHEQGGELDVLDFMQGVGMDFTSAYLFGSANGTDFMRDVEYRQHWLEEYKVFKTQLPRDRADCEVERWCLAMCEATERSMQAGKETGDPAGTQPVVYGRMAGSLKEMEKGGEVSGEKPRIVVAASEMLDHLIAGHETSGITLSYLMWELSKRPEMQERLRGELRGLEPQLRCDYDEKAGEEKRLPSSRDIDNLPFLDSLIQETLRLYAAAPGMQPRVTPGVEGGVSIEGYGGIPEGVVVSANAWCAHRDGRVWGDGGEWRPGRWEGEREEMKRWFLAFGMGGRMCLGSHFALQGEWARFPFFC